MERKHRVSEIKPTCCYYCFLVVHFYTCLSAHILTTTSSGKRFLATVFSLLKVLIALCLPSTQLWFDCEIALVLIF